MKRSTFLYVSAIFLGLTILSGSSDESDEYLQGYTIELGGLCFLSAVMSLFVRDKVSS